jgi:NAD(P)H-dependent FMN reductase
MTPNPASPSSSAPPVTRAFADLPAQWILEKAQARGDMDVELVDLRDFDLPLFNEVASNAWAPARTPRRRLAKEDRGFDGYIFVTAEYNRSITGALKNALDQAYVEWNRKAFGIVSYGSVGGTRAAEHLRTIGIELQMVSTRSACISAGPSS